MTIQEMADSLRRAEIDREAVEPFTDTRPDLDLAEAYEIQRALRDLHVEGGARIVGAKLGLTSRAKQEAMGVHEGVADSRFGHDPIQTVVVRALRQPEAGRILVEVDAVGLDAHADLSPT